MSHFAVYECNVSNIDFIKAGLADMNLSYKENVIITDWAGQKRQARLAVVKDGKLLPLGWVESEETKKLDLIADWYEVPFPERDFTEKISQHHAKYQVLHTCEENRWDVQNVNVNDKGEIEVIATQFA